MSTPIPAVNVPLNKVGETRLWVCVDRTLLCLMPSKVYRGKRVFRAALGLKTTRVAGSHWSTCENLPE